MNKTLFFTCAMLLATGLDVPILSKSPLPEATLTGPELAQNLPSNSPSSNNQFTLLEAGSEPRQELRFTPKIPSQETGRMTMNTKINLSFSGQTIPQMVRELEELK